MKTDFEGMDEVGDAIDGDMLFEKVRKNGYESLNLEEKNLIFLNKNLSDKVREYLEKEKDRKIEEQIYREKSGDSKEIFNTKVEEARFILAVNDEIERELMEKGVLAIKTDNKDERGRKPSRKLVKNVINVFNGKRALSKENIIYGLKNQGYSAEDITLNLYANWCVNWGILNLKNGDYVLNRGVIKEIYNI
jgi:hypothetical protein